MQIQNTDITDVDGNVRYLDVYVVNDNVNGGCKIDASVFTEAAVTPTFSGDKQAQYGEKNSEITDAYQTYELSLDKVVEGNMGDKNRKFNFTIDLVVRQIHPSALVMNLLRWIVTDPVL